MAFNTCKADEAFNEQQLSVAFLYNFLKFVEWPGSAAKTELNLCVADGARFSQYLDEVSGKQVQGKPVRVKHLNLGDKPLGCQLLFLPREETAGRIRQWLNTAGNAPMLTVSDLDEFLDLGGMIILINDGTHLKFEVNLGRAKTVGLKLSAQMLKIASEVKGD